MKKMRRFAAFVAAMAMVGCMAVPMTGVTSMMDSGVFMTASAADETYSITINNAATGHTYEAYQIFSGDLTTGENDELVLSNIKWAAGQADQAVGDDATATAATLTDKDALKAFIKNVTLGTMANSTSTQTDGKYVIGDLAPGYYLVKDANGSLNEEDDAYTAFIVEVVGDAAAEVKSAKPTVDKQVWDEAADAETTGESWGETADHAINESFEFRLIANLPDDDDLDAYTSYKLTFHDTMAASITFEEIVSVTVNGTPITGYTSDVEDNQVGGDWSLTIDNLKERVTDGDIKGAEVIVTYKAHMNEAAGIGNTDVNKNTVYLEYSNNPNGNGDSDNDGEEDTGKAAPDTVWVFTYKMDNKKTDGTNVLAGAGFRLYDANGAEVGLIYDDTLTAYRPIKGEEVAAEMFSAATTGEFDIVGLDAGTYTLKETTTPGGYNTCEDIKVVISATHAEAASEATASTTISMTKDGEAASEIVVINKKGASLPSTGGIGTTIFYVVGGALVAGAGVSLIAKKRVKNED